MNKDLRNAVKDAASKLKEADAAIENIEKYITFYRFSRIIQDEPRVTAYDGDDIVLKYRGREIPIERVIEIMEDAGYITPDDFSGYMLFPTHTKDEYFCVYYKC